MLGRLLMSVARGAESKSELLIVGSIMVFFNVFMLGLHYGESHPVLVRVAAHAIHLTFMYVAVVVILFGHHCPWMMRVMNPLSLLPFRALRMIALLFIVDKFILIPYAGNMLLPGLWKPLYLVLKVELAFVPATYAPRILSIPAMFTSAYLVTLAVA